MKKEIKHLLAAIFIGGTTATTVFGQQVITVDENGKGFFNASPLVSGIGTDPFSGMTTLVYTLPFPAQAGDIILRNSNGTVSDYYRFDGNFQLFVFSDFDLSEPNPTPADVGFPANPLPTFLSFPETGSEITGPTGLFGYNPGINDPGANTAGATYNFYSDLTVVPEPSSLALVAGGLGIFGLRFWRRR